MRTKGLIFDFDGTLGDSRECGILATQKAFSDIGLMIPDEKRSNTTWEFLLKNHF